MVKDFEKQTGDFSFVTGFMAGFQLGRTVSYKKAFDLFWHAPVGLGGTILEGIVSGFIQRRRSEHALRCFEKAREERLRREAEPRRRP